MAAFEVCYATRQEIMRALDTREAARNALLIDRANESAARSLEALTKRVFYPTDDTRVFDWPNYQYANPWRLWLHNNELAVSPALVIKAGTQVIPQNQVFYGPWMEAPGPPWLWIELDRSTSAAFGGDAPTPQRSISIQGTFGFDTNKDQVATLAAAISSPTATTLTISDGSRLGPGVVIIIDTERMLVQDASMSATGLSLSGTGVNTASANDQTLATTGTGALNQYEVVLIDAERMLVVDFTSGGAAVVKRGYDGTTVSTHAASAPVSALRTLVVSRGALGTSAATHSNAAPVYRHRVPSLVRDLSIAKAEYQLLGEASGYAGSPSAGGSHPIRYGETMEHLADKVCQRYRRNARIRAI